jgi:hypothetical protein
MTFRALDANGDWTFGKGISGFLIGKDALTVNLVTITKEWKGECFFAMQDGVDWNNYLDIGTKTLLDADLQRNWLKSYGVLRIDSYSSSLDTKTRQLTVKASLFTIYGSLTLSEVF